MHGNVQEWVQDWFEEYYYFDSPPEDPLGPKQRHAPDRSRRVLGDARQRLPQRRPSRSRAGCSIRDHRLPRGAGRRVGRAAFRVHFDRQLASASVNFAATISLKTGLSEWRILFFCIQTPSLPPGRPPPPNAWKSRRFCDPFVGHVAMKDRKSLPGRWIYMATPGHDRGRSGRCGRFMPGNACGRSSLGPPPGCRVRVRGSTCMEILSHAVGWMVGRLRDSLSGWGIGSCGRQRKAADSLRESKRRKGRMSSFLTLGARSLAERVTYFLRPNGGRR